MEGGLDSLGAVELRTAAAAAFSVSLPPTLAFDYPTIPEMAAFIATKLPRVQQHQQPPIQVRDFLAVWSCHSNTNMWLVLPIQVEASTVRNFLWPW